MAVSRIEEQRDAVGVGVRYRDVEAPVTVQIADRDLERTAADHVVARGTEALAAIAVLHAVVRDDCDRAAPGSRQDEVGPAIASDVRDRNRARRIEQRDIALPLERERLAGNRRA